MNRSSWLIGFPLVFLSAGIGAQVFPERVLGQSITAAEDGTGTIVSPLGNTVEITGGTTAGSNLFHSFQQFGVEAGQTANFQATPAIANILGRVTGGSPSYINGLLQVSNSSANLYLMNPAGMVFGTNAQLNLGGSFSATTAAGIEFTDGIFSAIGNNTYDLLVGAPNGFVFQNTGAIGSLVNFGNLAVQPGQNLNLVAGTIVSPGTLSAPNGSVSVITLENSAAAQTPWVRLSQTGMILGLDLPVSAGVDSLGFSPVTLPNLLTGGDVHNASELVVSADGVSLAGSGLRLEDGDLMAQEIQAGRVQIQGARDVVLAPVQSDKPVAIVATEDLKMRAADTITVRDSQTQPVQILSGGDLEITGLKAIDILALNHLNLGIPFQSGGDLTFTSDGLISTDSHFFSGGNFALQNTANNPAGFFSLYDPIISSIGNVSFGGYSGTSLKVEAGGNITVISVASTVPIPGNIFITGPDVTLANTGTDPDIPLLTEAASLILRAGVTSFSDSSVAVTTLPSIVGGTNFNTSAAGQGAIGVQGSISGNQLANVILEATNLISVTGNIIADAPDSRVVINAGNTSAVSTAAIAGNEISISGGSLSLGGTIASGTGPLTLTGDEINWANPISGTGSLLLQPLTPGLNMELGGIAGNFDLSPLDLTLAELNLLQDGFSDITIGRTNSSGALTLVGNVAFSDPVTLRSPSGFGSIFTQGFNLTGDTAITLQAGGSIFIPAGTTISSLSTPVDITLNSDRDGINDGAIVITDAAIDSNGGNIAMVGGTTGTGSAQGTRTNPDGVNITRSLVSAEGGTVTIRGEGFDSSSDPIGTIRGVNLTDSSILTLASGTIDIQGTGGIGVSNNSGIFISGNFADDATLGTETGAIILTGTGGSSILNPNANQNQGIYQGGTIASTAGNVTITGTGGIGTNENVGVTLGGDLSTTGNITVVGTGGTNGVNSLGDNNRGVVVTGTATTNGAGQISITGTGGSGVNNNTGVEIYFEAGVNSDSGLITITGNGSTTATGNFNRGVTVDGNVNSNTGNILLTGTGGSGVNQNSGIDLLSRGQISTSGNSNDPTQVSGIELEGLGSATATGDFNRGVTVAGTIVGTGAGSVEITGTARSGVASNAGVDILAGSTLTTAEGDMTVSGTGSATSSGGSNSGINVASTLISNEGGSLNLTGIGGTGTTSNTGVDLLDTSSLTVFNTGSIAITGTAGSGTGNNDGVRVQGTLNALSTGGMTLTGDSRTSTGTSNEAIEVTSTANLQTSGTGSIALNSDRPQANQGAILVNTNLTTNGGNITSSAGGDVIVNGTIATTGGNVTMSSDGNITTQGIQTDQPTGSAGSVNLTTTGTGNITVNSILTYVNSGIGNGGDIILNAGGNITTTGTDPKFTGTQTGSLKADLSQSTSSGQGGAIQLTSGGTIDTRSGLVVTAGNTDLTGSAKPITLTAAGNIFTAGVSSYIGVPVSGQVFPGVGNSGLVQLTSTGGTIDTTLGTVQSTTTSGGTAGAVQMTAAGNIRTSDVLSFIGSSGSGNTGGISLTSTGGSIDTTTAGVSGTPQLRSASGNGTTGDVTLSASGDITTAIVASSVTTGQAGNVTLTSQNGSINLQNTLRTRVLGSGNGGNIVLQSNNGSVTFGEINTSVGTTGNAGNVTINANGDIKSTGSFSQVGTNIAIGTFTQTGTDTSTAGNITLNSTTGKIDLSSGDVNASAVNGNVGTIGNGGNVSLTANSDINLKTVATVTNTGSGGNVAVTSNTGAINLRDVISDVRVDGTRSGKVDLTAFGDITTTATPDTAAFITKGNGNAIGGDVTITSTNGNVTINGDRIDANADNANAGNITISALGNITSTIATAVSNNGNGGNISITSLNGEIQIDQVRASSISTGNGGLISIASTNGDIQAGDIYTDANDDGGSISVTTGNSGNIVLGYLTSYTPNGNSGNITVQSQGNFSFLDRTLPGGGKLLTGMSTGHNGNISITSSTGSIDTSGGSISTGASGSINIQSLNGEATLGELYTYLISPGNAGNVSVQARGNINATRSIQTTSGSGNAGSVSLTSTNGNIITSVPSLIDVTSASGNSGNITFTALGGDITVDVLQAQTTTGNAGNINFQSGGAIRFGSINTRIRQTGLGKAGDVNLQAVGDITSTSSTDIGDQDYAIVAENFSSGNGGNVSLTSSDGAINVSSGKISTATSNGTAGSVDFQAFGDIASGAITTEASLNSGNVSLTSQSGDIAVTGSEIATRSRRGGNSGSITLLAPAGNISVPVLSSIANDPNRNGNGGDITIVAAEDITTVLIDTGSKSITSTGNAQVGNGGSVTLTAGGNINVGNIDTASFAQSNELGAIVSNGSGGNVTLNAGNALNMTLGIATNSGFFCGGGNCSFPNLNNLATGLGGTIAINAPQRVNIGGQLFTSATRQGGSIDINSGGSVTITQGINTQSNLSLSGAATNLLNGGDVAILTPGNITIPGAILTGSATTANPADSATAGAGGSVSLTSGDVITVGDIRTSTSAFARRFEEVRPATSGNAGAITLIATNAITAGNLEANSQWAEGGDITLDPLGDVRFTTADATGATNGGDLRLISTGSTVLATGILGEIRQQTRPECVGASICTNGTGTVFIQHGITDPFDPNAFRIGNPLLNGTTGAIVTGAGTLNNFNIPNQPGIVTTVNVSVTPGGFPPVPREPEVPTNPQVPSPPTELEQVEKRIVAGCPPECDFQDTEGTPPAPLDISYNLVLESIQAADERYTQEFTDYFGIPGRPLPTLQQLQQDLQAVEKDTGIKPAILFAILAPPTSEPTDPLQAVPESPLVRSSVPPQPPERFGMPTPRIPGVTVVSPATAPAGDLPTASRLTRGQPDDELEIVVITPNGTPIRQRVSGITRSQMMAATALLRQEVANPGNTDSDRYLQISQRLYNWIMKPVEAELQARDIESIAFVLEPGMRSLPIATLYDGNQFIIEKYSVGLMPNLSLTDTRYRDIRDFSLLGMGASTFTTQAPLPTVPVEVNTLTQKIWPSGEEYLNDQFTVAELKKQSDRFGVIHLATHADFVQGTPEGSYVQLSDGRLTLTQLRELGWAARNTDTNPPVELLTLSACRTAVGVAEDNPDTIIGSELGFAGVAFAAGVKTSLASLWYVSDAATAALMTEFYQTLAQIDVYRSGILKPELKPNTIAPLKAEALRQTQLALLRGEIQIQGETLEGLRGSVNNLALPSESIAALGSDRVFTHPYYWAAFTLIGNPW